MGHFPSKPFLAAALLPALSLAAHAQVFVVGEKTATSSINTAFKPTHVELPTRPMNERARRELMRDLDMEQGFAHRVLPLGATLTLQANGNMTPGDDAFKEVVYKKGQSAAPGDRIVITALEVKGDRLILDLNGGPYPPHRFLRHIQVGVGGAYSPAPDLGEQATGCRIALVFEGGTPEVSAPEVKALLEPIIDFGAKTGETAYAETLPTPLKASIESHDVLVGMNHRMVLAALGEPEHKLREGSGDRKYEEWIFGHQPGTVRFVRFEGDRVTQIKIAALGKPMEIHTLDEMEGYHAPADTRVIALGDSDTETKSKAGPPTLQLPGETLPANDGGEAVRKVKFPDDKENAKPIPPVPTDTPVDPTKPSLAAPDPMAPAPPPPMGTPPPLGPQLPPIPHFQP
jgi:hypothetical protein